MRNGNSRFAYEWFQNQRGTNKFRVCVLWLNEDDFADEPALRWGSLVAHFSTLTNSNGVASFYLVGPRASDTLQAFVQTSRTNTESFRTLEKAAQLGHFHILSTEATASLHLKGSANTNDLNIGKRVKDILDINIFHPWIAPDRQVASLIAEELTNRIGYRRNPHDVVVVLSEQDTYYGRKLADEWISALTDHACICASPNNVWQYAYLCGLDGSKPRSESPRPAPTLAPTPEGALETVMLQQQEGERADGDAQLDYVLRLAESVKERDRQLIAGTKGGRVVAVGVAGSDTYDKLILLPEFRRRVPEAIFFTTDLDASLWTAQSLKYTRNLLVGSAYPVDPTFRRLDFQPYPQQFAPFRDVYQTAVFKACSGIVTALETGTNVVLNGNSRDLKGALYVIGSHGPVKVSTPGDILDIADFDSKHVTIVPWYPAVLALLMVLGYILYFFTKISSGVCVGRKKQSRLYYVEISEAQQTEREQYISWIELILMFVSIIGAFLAAWVVQWLSKFVSRQPGEEPWDFFDGVSIWPTEYLRLLTLAGAVFSLFLRISGGGGFVKNSGKNFFVNETKTSGSSISKIANGGGIGNCLPCGGITS